jgi:hypothetical protein
VKPHWHDNLSADVACNGGGEDGVPRGRGRPPVGERIEVRLPADVLAVFDGAAGEYGTTRAAVIRHALEVAAASAELNGWDGLRP